MSGEPARRRALRLWQAAHYLLPSLEPRLPIDVRLGRSRPIGGPWAVCCGYDHSIWIRRSTATPTTAVAAAEETRTRSSAVHLSRAAQVDRHTFGRSSAQPLVDGPGGGTPSD